nr:amidohydrolase [Allobranchiibius huperziae]
MTIDAGGRRVVPGLNDSHMHTVRGGLMYNLELRWDGVGSLERGLTMIRHQATRTPSGQWVRVMGGWSPWQFSERRMPTTSELTEAAPTTPVLVLYGYSKVIINRAGVKALGIASDSDLADSPDYALGDDGCIVTGNTAVYAVIAKLPNLDRDDERESSTRLFLRELNRFGLTSTVDAGERNTSYPDDYRSMAGLAGEPGFAIRLSNFLFAQRPGSEEDFWERTTHDEKPDTADAALDARYRLRGAGEVLAWAAHDYENFLAARPELSQDALDHFEAVTRILAEHDWPIRVHATYDQTIGHFLDVFERVFPEVGYTSRWLLDHAETIGPRNIERLKALGGGIAVQNRLSFSGEYFLERYGSEAAAAVQPLRALLDAGIPMGAGTDATRPASYNPWISLYWMITGRTVGGTQVADPSSRLTREEALHAYTVGSAWLSGEEHRKGRIAAGQDADFAILSEDYMTVPTEAIPTIESVLTVTGGAVVYTAPPFSDSLPVPPIAVLPTWSPVVDVAGFSRRADR